MHTYPWLIGTDKWEQVQTVIRGAPREQHLVEEEEEEEDEVPAISRPPKQRAKRR